MGLERKCKRIDSQSTILLLTVMSGLFKAVNGVCITVSRQGLL